MLSACWKRRRFIASLACLYGMGLVSAARAAADAGAVTRKEPLSPSDAGAVTRKEPLSPGAAPLAPQKEPAPKAPPKKGGDQRPKTDPSSSDKPSSSQQDARDKTRVRPRRISTSAEQLGATGAPDIGEAPPKEEKRSGHIIVPLAIYAPETHLGLGGFYVYFFRLGQEPIETRTSSLSFIAIVTTRKQLILEFLPDFYWDNEAWHVKGKLEFQKFPDSFWGIGPRTPDSNEERYDRSRLRFRGGPLRRIVDPIYIGAYTDIMYFTADYPDPDGVFATEDVPGEPGGVTVGIGPHMTYDSRDNALSSHRGTYLDLKLIHFGRRLGSEYQFGQGILDARQFIPLAEKHTLALRLFTQLEYGNPPYYQLALLGGDDLVRGYFLGRYRDKHLVALEAEYRYPLFWLFSGVAFIGASELAPRMGEFDADPIRWAGGGGLRLLLNRQERLNLRFDVGVGPGTFGAYLSATEAF